MALTVAVEEVISEHYKEQLRELDKFEYSISDEDIQLKKVRDYNEGIVH